MPKKAGLRNGFLEKELKKIKRLYNKNFDLLLNSKNILEKDKYLKIEKELNKKEKDLMSRLGKYAGNVCPLSVDFACQSCIGWFIRPKDVYRHKNYECLPYTQGANKCDLKHI